MLTLDQMALFLAVVQDGSFSAAARKAGRTQSSVTYAMQAMEAQLGVAVFDRSGYRPVLTEAGQQVLPRITRILRDVEDVTALSQGIAGGLEARVTIVVDAIYPMDRLVGVLKAFQQAFPTVPTHLSVEVLGSAFAMVLEGIADIGIVGHVPERLAAEVERQPLDDIGFTVVAAPDHPLAAAPAPLGPDAVRDHLQLVLSDRSQLTDGVSYGVYATRIWRVADMGAKLAMLRAGLGWGGMPRHMVAADIAEGRLVELALDAAVAPQLMSNLRPSLISLRREAKGPAVRWLRERFRGA